MHHSCTHVFFCLLGRSSRRRKSREEEGERNGSGEVVVVVAVASSPFPSQFTSLALHGPLTFFIDIVYLPRWLTGTRVHDDGGSSSSKRILQMFFPGRFLFFFFCPVSLVTVVSLFSLHVLFLLLSPSFLVFSTIFPFKR